MKIAYLFYLPSALKRQEWGNLINQCQIFKCFYLTISACNGDILDTCVVQIKWLMTTQYFFKPSNVK